MQEAGRVGDLVRKSSSGTTTTGKDGIEDEEDEDDEAQILEDVACLVFLDDRLEEFEKGQSEEKVLGILRKTWLKMSPRGRELALNDIHMSDRARRLVEMAVAGT